MPNWKKVLVSGSDASLNSLYVNTSVTASIFSGSFSGSLFGTSSWSRNSLTASSADNFIVRNNLTASNASFSGSVRITGSLALTGSLTIGSAFLDYNQNLSVATGSYQVIASEPTASYRAAFFDYVAFSGSISRAGSVHTVWSASVTEWFENYTADLGGSTSGIILQTAISSGNIQLQATASNAAWSIRSLVRML
jgi:hypothetical protein